MTHPISGSHLISMFSRDRSNSNYILTNEQSLWIEDTIKSVNLVLSKNPPEGEIFSKRAEH